MMIMVSLQKNSQKFSHGEVTDSDSLDLVNKCHQVKRRTTCPDYVLIIFQFHKFHVELNMQLFSQVSFLFKSNLAS
jgi:hypothetical protein